MCDDDIHSIDLLMLHNETYLKITNKQTKTQRILCY